MSSQLSRRRLLQHSIAATVGSVGLAGTAAADDRGENGERLRLRSHNRSKRPEEIRLRAIDRHGCPDDRSGPVRTMDDGYHWGQLGFTAMSNDDHGPGIFSPLTVEQLPDDEVPDGAEGGLLLHGTVEAQSRGILWVQCADSFTVLDSGDGLTLEEV